MMHCIPWRQCRLQQAGARRFLSSSTATTRPSRVLPRDGLTLADFVQQSNSHSASKDSAETVTNTPPVVSHFRGGQQKTSARARYASQPNPYPSRQSTPVSFHLKTFGCQMNVSDSDICRSILLDAGLVETLDEKDAQVVLTNTCAIRENAEHKVWQRLRELRAFQRKLPKRHPFKNQSKRIVGVLGCMAERLQHTLLKEGVADLVVGPDAYRELPKLIRQLTMTPNQVDDDDDDMTPLEQAVSVELSKDETYADITPVRQPSDSNSVSAFVSIQRGCANRCSFCIVPFTRGQERSRPLTSIVEEITRLVNEQNVKEVTLLGQNVNSYHDTSTAALQANPEPRVQNLSNDGFQSRTRRVAVAGHSFADLVAQVSDISPELRVRFTSPHPKDYPPDLLDLMAERPNVCNQLHLPAQSGSSATLKRMKRGYTREAYLELVQDQVWPTIPDVALSSDFIAGFCGETHEEHLETLSLMELVQYDQAFMFAYSVREPTHAHRTMVDDVPPDVKQRRLAEIIDTFQRQVHAKNEQHEVGLYRCVLVEGASKKNPQQHWQGRTDQNKRVRFEINEDRTCPTDDGIVALLKNRTPALDASPQVILQAGDYAIVKITEARGHTLRGELQCRTTLQAFSELGLDHHRERHERLDTALRQDIVNNHTDRSSSSSVA